MYFIYLLTSILEYVFSKRVYNKRINPISVYIITWNIVAFLYVIRLVYLYDVTFASWITVILFQLVFVCGVLFGNRCTISDKKLKKANKASLDRIIIILCIISSLAIIPNFVNFIQKYSFDFMMKMNRIYDDRLNGTRGYELIPYLGCLSYLGVAVAGVYFRRFGFSLLLFFPIALSVLDALPSGGRGNLVLIVLLFIVPSLFYGLNKDVKSIKLSFKTKKLIGVLLGMVAVLFIRVSSIRSRWITLNSYMSPTMVKLVKISPVFYKTYTYIVNPFVSLSEYLKKPTYTFGINTFGMFRNILNKLGFNLAYQRYQDELSTPLSCNVATYIREIIQDFTYIGAIVVVFVFALSIGLFYKKTKETNSVESELVCTIFGVIAIMSFFVFFFRETMFWIMLFTIPFLKYMGGITIGIQGKI